MLETYKLEIKDGGVFAVSFVRSPAVKINALTFEINKSNNEEKRLVVAPLITANNPIFRRDEVRGEHYVIFTKELISDVIEKLSKEGNELKYNIYHSGKLITGVFMIESYQVDLDRGVRPPENIDVEDGTWIATFKIENEDLWNLIKDEKVKGLSIEGNFFYPDEIDDYMEILKTINKITRNEFKRN